MTRATSPYPASSSPVSSQRTGNFEKNYLQTLTFYLLRTWVENGASPKQLERETVSLLYESAFVGTTRAQLSLPPTNNYDGGRCIGIVYVEDDLGHPFT